MNFHRSQDGPQDLIRIWKPQALTPAATSRTPDAVARFLQSKGIPRDQASEAAINIWREAQRARVRADSPRLVLGLGFVFLGMAAATYLLIAYGRLSFVTLLPVLLGSRILWTDFLSE